MITRTAAAVAVLIALGSASTMAVERYNNFNLKSGKAFAPEYGATLPPIGYVNYCARHAAECRAKGGRQRVAPMTPDRWNLLVQVNTFVNRKIRPASDQQLYRVPEHWTIPSRAGDCEDYVLLKKRYLEGLGFKPQTLLITVVLDEEGQGHAVLTVRTQNGDVVLDNRRNEVLVWSKTRYVFLKRQSQHNPRKWVALTKRQHKRSNTIAGRN